MNLKKITAALAAATIMATSVVTPAFAEVKTDHVIDTTLNGSITLHKIFENDGNNEVTDGRVREETRTPVNNVEFSYKKVADIIQVAGRMTSYEGGTTNPQVGNDVVGLYFANIDSGYKAAVNEALGLQDDKLWDKCVKFEGDDTKYYTTEEMEYFLNMANDAAGKPELTSGAFTGETRLNTFLVQSGSPMPMTDANGKTFAGDLPLGLYLVGETDITAHDGLKADGTQYTQSPNPEAPVIETPASPFYVCLPTTNITEDGGKAAGTEWLYDLNVYPKDSRNSIFKRIVDPDETGDRTLRTREDYQIGDTIEQIIYADAPKLQSFAQDETTFKKTHKKYIIQDEMTTGLTVDKITEVAICNKVADAKKDTDFSKDNGYKVLAKNTSTVEGDYIVAGEGTQKFTVTFTEKGLKALDAITQDSQVVVKFTSTLNGDAKIGTVVENENHPTLIWRNSNTLDRSYEGNPVKVYTYGLDLKKEGLTDGTKAAFKVQRHDTMGTHTDDKADVGFLDTLVDGVTNVQFVKISDGVYRVYDKNGEYAHIDTDASKVTDTLHPAANGKLDITGFDSNRYTFIEIQTEGDRSTTDELSTNSEDQGKDLLKTTFDLDFVAPNPAADATCGADGIFTPDRNGELTADTTASVTNRDANGGGTKDSTPLQTKTDNKGIALLTVNNYKTVTLRTGGEGRMMLYVFGFAALVSLGAIEVIRRKKSVA